ncbi:MAG: AAA family ATPase [Gemmatimonadaceae bacterium]|nr:AAA family ATPase [Gemmatimonadaceae bacterium]
MKLYFLGGVHGAGKTALSQALATLIGGVRLSASDLIREEGVEPSAPDKRVSDIDANQERLLWAIDKRRHSATPIILDGHFCLRNASGEATAIPPSVFVRLMPDALMLLEAPAEEITQRLSARDAQSHSLNEIRDLLACEKQTAEQVSALLAIPLRILGPTSSLDDAVPFLKKLHN